MALPTPLPLALPQAKGEWSLTVLWPANFRITIAISVSISIALGMPRTISMTGQVVNGVTITIAISFCNNHNYYYRSQSARPQPPTDHRVGIKRPHSSSGECHEHCTFAISIAMCHRVNGHYPTITISVTNAIGISSSRIAMSIASTIRISISMGSHGSQGKWPYRSH